MRYYIPIADEILAQYLAFQQFQKDNKKGILLSLQEGYCSYSIKRDKLASCVSVFEPSWDDLARYEGLYLLYYPKVHNLYKRPRSAVQEAWDSITHERIKELVRRYNASKMSRRVIMAKGGSTRW